MIARRMLLAGALSGLAAPFILRSTVRAADPRVRRDVMDLPDNDPFFSKYAEAVRKMHQLPESDRRNWRAQARIHADFCKHGPNLSFLHWHRHYLVFFETICGELIGDPDFALPYWNWSKKSGILPLPFYDVQELNVEYWNDPGVYTGQSWGAIDSIARRGLAKNQGLLNDPVRGGSFTIDTINEIKTATNANVFRARLEGSPHNSGHVVVGAMATGKVGHIGDGLSPLDPIFWLHHCMVDRVWAEWQRTHTTPDPGETYDKDFVDAKGAPANVKSGSADTVAALGYSYDVLQPSPFAGVPTGTLLSTIRPELERVLREPAVPVTLGAANNNDVSMPLVETAITVSAPNLASTLATERAIRTFSVGREVIRVEGRRTIARITDVRLSGRNDLIVNVFVNCPYLSPSTPYVDPHYAGTFSFFGQGGHASHAGGGEFVVDITAPARSLINAGRIRNEQLTIQLMPVPAYMGAKTETSFRAGKVEIIAS